MPAPNKYPRELRERAVRMVTEIGERGAISRVAKNLGINPETLRSWVNKAPIETGGRRGLTQTEIDELKVLRKENSELKRANEILKAASVFFAKELDHPRTR